MSTTCPGCEKKVYAMEMVSALDSGWHPRCFKCTDCKKVLAIGNFNEHDKKPYCSVCYGKSFTMKGYGYGGTLSSHQSTGSKPGTPKAAAVGSPTIASAPSPAAEPPKLEPVVAASPKVEPPKADPPKADPPKADPPKADPPVASPVTPVTAAAPATPEARFCTQCGTRREPSARFCSHCGEPLSK
eukprot:TRINITY_DN1888_c0_g1_i1.p2 TRINITY_DN1888_c0_g1~~TRINITY_DN1888_c0_g1_i1.p2  ORF type:complete len:186 (+),score=22.25 TRINITY_DN1888_c0_g1_i1:67-624(+)